MKVLKYKVTDQRVRYISDVDALYGSGDSENTGKVGIIQKLSAEYGKYLDESVAIPEQFQKSLQSGCLRKFIDARPPLIVVEEVESSTNKTAGVVDAINSNPYNIAPLKEVIGDDGLVAGIKTVSDESRVVDWNKLTIEEKRALMIADEAKEKERIRKEEERKAVLDWNSLSDDEKRKLTKEFNKHDINSQSKKNKQKTTKKIKYSNVSVVQEKKVIGLNKKETPMIKGDGVLLSEIQKIETFEHFSALKYQEQLQFISTTDSIQLLEDIMKNAKREMIVLRAMKRVKVLRG